MSECVRACVSDRPTINEIGFGGSVVRWFVVAVLSSSFGSLSEFVGSLVRWFVGSLVRWFVVGVRWLVGYFGDVGG